MDTKALIAIVVALGLLFATWLFTSGPLTPNRDQGPTTTQASPGPNTGVEYKIVLTDDGFSPKEISIKVGDTVVFSTTTGRPFWPASNLHPSHRDYPEFDPKEPIMPDETWSFRFEKPGDWGMHDHLAPYFTGVIHVSE